MRSTAATNGRNGPREAVLTLIDSHISVVLELDDAAVQALRRSI